MILVIGTRVNEIILSHRSAISSLTLNRGFTVST
jgi:hypothetical protein